MNILDYILLGFVALLVIRGFLKGFIISLATLAGLILGIYAAVYFSGIMSGFLVEKFHTSGTWLPILSFSLTFLVVLIAVILIGKLVEKAAESLKLSLLNKFAGALFGLMKGVIIASILLFIIGSIDSHDKLIPPKTKTESLFYKPVAKVFPWILNLVGWKVPEIASAIKL
jgi:membrane protein required for colicin V production